MAENKTVIAPSSGLAALAPLDKPAASEDSSPMPAAPDTPPSSHCGQMIITLQPNGTSLPVPIITFNPVGQFTERMMEHYLTLFAQAIQREQSKVRYAQTHGHERGEPVDNEPLVAEEIV